MHSLSQLLEQAKMGRVATGHFNVSDIVLLKAVCSSAMDLQVSVLVGVLVEREIGDIGTGSEIYEEKQQEPRTLTTPDEAGQFVEATRVDILARRTSMRCPNFSRSPQRHVAVVSLDLQRLYRSAMA